MGFNPMDRFRRHEGGALCPFNENKNTYASDFIGDAMGYYPSTANYSYLFINNFQRLSLESKISSIKINLQELLKLNLTESFIQTLQADYDLFFKYYHELNFQLANEYLNQLQTLINDQIDTGPNGLTPPIIYSAPLTSILNLGSSKVLSWQVYSQNPKNYDVLINNSKFFSGIWNKSSLYISFTFKGEIPGLYNITLVIYDIFGNYAMNSTLFYVRDNVQNTATSFSQSSKHTGITSFDIWYSVFLPFGVAVLILLKRKKFR